MFHVELRQGRELARAFNRDERAVRTLFIEPLRGDALFRYADKEWDPRRARLTVLEGRELRPDELMLGRGWQSAQKVGKDVTEALLARDLSGGLEERIVGRLAAGPLPLAEVVTMTAELLPGARVSQRLAVAEQAVWELLHREQAALRTAGGGDAVARERWQPTLLSADAWFGAQSPVLVRP